MENPMTKVAIIDGAFAPNVHDMFVSKGYQPVGLEEADIIVFTGGADIDASMYGEQNLTTTRSFPDRDRAEKAIYEAYPTKPKIGICRGGQLLNVLNGGRLWQDVNNHGVEHMIHDRRRNILLRTSSLHHQMMIPSEGAEVLAVAGRATQFAGYGRYIERKRPTSQLRPDDWDDVEVVWYPKTRCLCYQPHPEIGSEVERKYFFSLIEKYILSNLDNNPSN
jgi:hypothetical protein